MTFFEKTIKKIYRVLWLDWNNLATFIFVMFLIHVVVPVIFITIALKNWLGHPQFHEIGSLYCQRWVTLSFLFFVLPLTFLLIGYVIEKLGNRLFAYIQKSKNKKPPARFK